MKMLFDVSAGSKFIKANKILRRAWIWSPGLSDRSSLPIYAQNISFWSEFFRTSFPLAGSTIDSGSELSNLFESRSFALDEDSYDGCVCSRCTSTSLSCSVHEIEIQSIVLIQHINWLELNPTNTHHIRLRRKFWLQTKETESSIICPRWLCIRPS